MKKIFMIALAAIAMISAATSCKSCTKDDVKFGVEYNLTITGDADGDVAVTFNEGSLRLNGVADVDFIVSNMDTVDGLANAARPLLDSLLVSNDAQTRAAAEAMAAEVDKFGAAAAGGSYDFLLDGVLREKLTGLEARITRRFTNRENAVAE